MGILQNEVSLKTNLAVDLMNSGSGSNGNVIYLAGPLSYHSLAFLKWNLCVLDEAVLCGQ